MKVNKFEFYKTFPVYSGILKIKDIHPFYTITGKM